MKHNYNWEISHTTKEPMNYNTSEREIAYIICRDCGSVRKEEIKQETKE